MPYSTFIAARRTLGPCLLILAGLGLVPCAGAEGRISGYGATDVYARIPERDDLGREQRPMFREWNPDPVANHEANLRAIRPALAAVVRKVQADNPDLSFVIGSGRRDAALQQKAVAWGWSRTLDSAHQRGEAVDLWPLDRQGHVSFDPAAQERIGVAVKKAAEALGVPIRWGGSFQGYKNRDRSHFELVLE